MLDWELHGVSLVCCGHCQCGLLHNLDSKRQAPLSCTSGLLHGQCAKWSGRAAAVQSRRLPSSPKVKYGIECQEIYVALYSLCYVLYIREIHNIVPPDLSFARHACMACKAVKPSRKTLKPGRTGRTISLALGLWTSLYIVPGAHHFIIGTVLRTGKFYRTTINERELRRAHLFLFLRQIFLPPFLKIK